jgi:glycosyltransferase involved in cell wall biosynthesis
MHARMPLYRRLVPFGSRRDRFLWIALVTLRKMREGPGPWLRAVKKGLYQLLPSSWQQRVLRWTGKDQFFRKQEVRHVGPAAGVERPGHVSVVLPVFNQADMVAQAIDSVLAQRYASFELIVVDDGSSDDLHDAVRPYLADPRVRVVTQPNQGLPKALSNGFEFATGEYFTWTSADNRMHPDQLARLVASLEKRPEVAMVYADYELIDERGELLEGGEFRVMDRTDKSNLAVVRVHRSTHDLNRYEDNFIGACFLYRGQVGRLLGDYNPELGLEDYDYWLRINRLFCVEHLGTDEVLYQYRVHENTLSAKARELKIAERAKALMAYERERAAWCDAPFSTIEGGTTGDGKARPKRLRRETPAQLAASDWSPPATYEAVACWFDTPEQAHLAHASLRAAAVAAFAEDEQTLARLSVYTRAVFRGGDDDDARDLAERFASNATFFRRTRDPVRLARAVPAPLPMPGEEPLRVLLQLDALGSGGLERVTADLATCWLQQGCEVGLLAVEGNDGPLPAGVERVTLRSMDDAGYARAIADGRWHAVSAHASTFGAAAAANAGVPFVQVVHNSYVWMEPEQVQAYRDADSATAAYVCVSAQALGYADLRMQLDVTKMLVIENGVATASPTSEEDGRRLRAELGLAADDFMFLQAASLQPAKAHRAGVRAFARLRERNPRAKLVCLGSEMNPIYAAAVRADVQQLGLQDAVVLAGHRDDAAACYRAADAFFLPSFWEGCSLAVLEAAQAGLPLILSDVGAAREQLRMHGGHGRLVAPPFESMFALDASNVPALVGRVDEDFVERLAAAMEAAMALGRAEPGLPPAADRATMAARHLSLLRWLRQGGAVPAAREAIARARSGNMSARIVHADE